MGIAQAGIAFRISDSVTDVAAFIGAVFAEPATEIPLPLTAHFDIRNHGDVMVQTFGEVCFISNDDLALPLIAGDSPDSGRLHAALGAPALLMAFCHDDARGSHGYAIFEHGRRVRSRLQRSGDGGAHELAESGAPRPFEQRWLAARHYLEAETAAAGSEARVYFLGDREVLVPGRELTGRMLQDGLAVLFGVCPWKTLLTPTYRFFRLGPGRPRGDAPAMSRAKPIRASKRPWWQIR